MNKSGQREIDDERMDSSNGDSESEVSPELLNLSMNSTAHLSSDECSMKTPRWRDEPQTTVAQVASSEEQGLAKPREQGVQLNGRPGIISSSNQEGGLPLSRVCTPPLIPRRKQV